MTRPSKFDLLLAYRRCSLSVLVAARHISSPSGQELVAVGVFLAGAIGCPRSSLVCAGRALATDHGTRY